MNPLKKFGKRYQRIHSIARGICIILLAFLFLALSLVWFVSLSLSLSFRALADLYINTYVVPWELISASFIIVGFVTLSAVMSIHKRHEKLARGIGGLLLLPFLFWGYTVIRFTLVYWQISLLILATVGATFIVWKLWGKRAWELRCAGAQKKSAVDWELEDQLKGLDEQVFVGTISRVEYEQKKKELLEKSEA